jgi:hypothetical protein
MTTSINEAVNWRKAAVTPDYKVGAKRVDTFVQGERNSKGKQVAAALESAAGTLGTIAQDMAQKQERELSEAEAREEALDKMGANNLTSKYRGLMSNWRKQTDLTQFNNEEEAFKAFKAAHPSYDDDIASIKTDAGRVTFGTEFFDDFSQNYATERYDQQQFQTAETVSTFVTNQLTMNGQEAQNMEVNDPRFYNLVLKIENQMSGVGYNTNQSRYEALAEVGIQQYRANGDKRLIDYINGKSVHSTAIGGTKFRESLNKQAAAIDREKRTELIQKRQDESYELSKNQVSLAKDTGAILAGNIPEEYAQMKPSEMYNALAQKYTQMGVPDALTRVKSMRDAHESLDDEVLPLEDSMNLWMEFLNIKQPSGQQEWLAANAKNGRLNKALFNQLVSRVGNNDNQAIFGMQGWKEIQVGINSLATDKKGFREAEYAYLEPVAAQLWLNAVTDPEWNPAEEFQLGIDIINTLKKTQETLKGGNMNPIPTATGYFEEFEEMRMLNKQVGSGVLTDPDELADAMKRINELKEKLGKQKRTKTPSIDE